MNRYDMLDLEIDDPGAPVPPDPPPPGPPPPEGGEQLQYRPTTRVLFDRTAFPSDSSQGWQPHDLVFAVGEDTEDGTWVTVTPLQFWLNHHYMWDREMTGLERILPPYMGVPEDESTWFVEGRTPRGVLLDLGRRGFVHMPDFQAFCARTVATGAD